MFVFVAGGEQTKSHGVRYSLGSFRSHRLSMFRHRRVVSSITCTCMLSQSTTIQSSSFLPDVFAAPCRRARLRLRRFVNTSCPPSAPCIAPITPRSCSLLALRLRTMESAMTRMCEGLRPVTSNMVSHPMPTPWTLSNSDVSMTRTSVPPCAISDEISSDAVRRV